MSKTQVTIQLNAIDGFSNQFSKIENNVKSISNQFKFCDKKSGMDFDKLSFNLRQAGNDFNNLSNNIEKFTNKSKKSFSNLTKGLFNGFNEVTMPFKNINNKINHFLGSGLSSADDLNTNMKRIAFISHLSKNEINDLKLKSEQISNSVAASTSKLSGLMLTAVRSAVKTADGIISSSKLGMMLGNDLKIDPEFALKSIVRFTHAYGEGEDKFDQNSDLLLWMKEISGSDLQQVNYGLEDSAPVAKSFNVPKTDLATMYTQMALGGVEGTKAATAIRNFLYGSIDPKMLMKLAKGNEKLTQILEADNINPVYNIEKLDKWSRATKILKIDPDKIWKNGNLQLFEYLIPSLQEAQKTLSPDVYGAALRNMFNKHGIAGITKMSAATDNGGVDIFQTRERMTKYKGQTKTQHQFYIDSYRGKLDLISAQFENLKTEIVMSGLLEYTIKFLTKLTECFVKIIAFTKEHPNLTKFILVFAGISVVVLKLLFFVATLAHGLWALSIAFKFLGGLAGIAGGMLGTGFIFVLKKLITFLKFAGLAFRALGLLFLSNPFGIAIAALSLIGYIIYKNWTSIKNLFINVWDWIKQAFFGYLNYLKNGFEIITGFFVKIKSFFTGKKEDILKDINGNLNVSSTHEYKPFYDLPVPKKFENKSIIELNIKNAPKDSIVTSKNYGNNPPTIKFNMGYQDFAYE